MSEPTGQESTQTTQSETEEVADVTVYVYEDGHGPGRAHPGHVLVARGATISWENITGSSLLLLFPEPGVFEGGVTGLSVEADKRSQPLRIREDAKRGGHPYVGVTTDPHEAPQFVEGGSHPVMIIV